MFPSKKGDFYRFDIKTPMVDWSLKQITLTKKGKYKSPLMRIPQSFLPFDYHLRVQSIIIVTLQKKSSKDYRSP